MDEEVKGKERRHRAEADEEAGDGVGQQKVQKAL